MRAHFFTFTFRLLSPPPDILFVGVSVLVSVSEVAGYLSGTLRARRDHSSGSALAADVEGARLATGARGHHPAPSKADLVCAVLFKGPRTGSTWIERELHNNGGPCVERFIPPFHQPDLRINAKYDLRMAIAQANEDIVRNMKKGRFDDDEVCGEFFFRKHDPRRADKTAAHFLDRVRNAFACSPLNYTKQPDNTCRQLLRGFGTHGVWEFDTSPCSTVVVASISRLNTFDRALSFIREQDIKDNLLKVGGCLGSAGAVLSERALNAIPYHQELCTNSLVRHRPLHINVSDFQQALHKRIFFDLDANRWEKRRGGQGAPIVHMTYELLVCIEAHAPGSVGATVANRFFDATEPWKLPEMKVLTRAPVQSEILNYDKIANEMRGGKSNIMLRRGLNCSHLAVLASSGIRPPSNYTSEDLGMIFVEVEEKGT